MASFGQKIGNTVSSTVVGLALSMAKEVGILQVLLEAERPLTSAEVADKKQLKERYVRELLCCLATAEVVHAARNEDSNIVYFFEAEEKQVFQTQLMSFISFPALMTTLFAPIKACLPISGPNDIDWFFFPPRTVPFRRIAFAVARDCKLRLDKPSYTRAKPQSALASRGAEDGGNQPIGALQQSGCHTLMQMASMSFSGNHYGTRPVMDALQDFKKNPSKMYTRNNIADIDNGLGK